MRIHPINSNSETNTEGVTEDNYMCSICLQSTCIDNVFLECIHTYHPMCIYRWSRTQIKNNYTISCPYCKVGYNYKLFITKITSNFITEINNIIHKLQSVLDNGSISYIDYKLTYTLQCGYKRVLKQSKNKKYQKESEIFNYKINPIPDNILKLILKTEQRTNNNNNEYNKYDEKNIKLLQKECSNCCKNRIFNILKFIF